MNTEINKKISQFLDDELHHSEEENLLAKIRQQPELTNKMKRYQAVSHMIKTDDFVMVEESFLDKINQQLKQEPHHFRPQHTAKKKTGYFWQKTSLALAASVACVAIIVSQQTAIQKTESQHEVILTAQKQPTEIPSLIVKKPVSSQDKAEKSQHDRFKTYLQAHSDELYTHGSFDYQPYARVANYGRK